MSSATWRRFLTNRITRAKSDEARRQAQWALDQFEAIMAGGPPRIMILGEWPPSGGDLSGQGGKGPLYLG